MPIDVPSTMKRTLKPVTNRSACGRTAARVAATVPGVVGDGRVPEEGEVDRQQREHARRDEAEEPGRDGDRDADLGHVREPSAGRAGATPGSTTIGCAMIHRLRTV